MASGEPLGVMAESGVNLTHHLPDRGYNGRILIDEDEEVPANRDEEASSDKSFGYFTPCPYDGTVRKLRN